MQGRFGGGGGGQVADFGLFFFQFLPTAQKFWAKQGLFSASGELGKPNWST